MKKTRLFDPIAPTEGISFEQLERSISSKKAYRYTESKGKVKKQLERVKRQLEVEEAWMQD